jgi:intraflagellar transport protein 172
LASNSPSSADEAVKLVGSKNFVVSDSSMQIVKKIVKRVLSRSKDEESKDHVKVVSLLRDVLYKFATQLRSQSSDKSLSNELFDLLMAVHYTSIFYLSSSLTLREIVAKCAITLLKYPELVPHDKAFYQAGCAARDQGNTNLAFLMFNRYVDIAEAMDAADSTNLDVTDLQDADGIPQTNFLPQKHFLKNEVTYFVDVHFYFIVFVRMIVKMFGLGSFPL